jgi:hypothetical protein
MIKPLVRLSERLALIQRKGEVHAHLATYDSRLIQSCGIAVAFEQLA